MPSLSRFIRGLKNKLSALSSARKKMFDTRLLAQVERSRIPAPAQLKYIGRFMSRTERRVIAGSLSVALVAVLSWGALFISRHITVSPQAGGEFTEALVGQPQYINPLLSRVNEVDADLSALIYSGLFKYDNRQLVPDLAAGYSLDESGKIYTINLKPGLTWSDGEPLTASDVLFTMELAQSIDIGSPMLASFQGVTFTQVDDLTFTATLKETFTPFIHALTMGILPEHAWNTVSPETFRLVKANLEPTVGSGPWKFSKLIKDHAGRIQTYSLQRNERYHGAAPYFKNLTLAFSPDYTTAVEALHNQTVDGMSFIPRQWADQISTKSYAAAHATLPQLTVLFFNDTDHEFLKAKNIRSVLAGTIDKSALISILNGQARPIEGPLLPDMVDLSPLTASSTPGSPGNEVLDKDWQRIQPEEFFSLRVAELKKERQAHIEEIITSSDPAVVSSTLENFAQELEQLVRNEMNESQTFYRKNNKDELLKLTITTIDRPDYQTVAQAIADSWQSLGIHTSVAAVDSRSITKDVIRNRTFQILLYGQILGADADLFAFWHSSQTKHPGLNLAQFASRTADTLIEQARTTLDPAKRAGLYGQLQNHIVGEIPAVFLYSPLHTVMVKKSVRGVHDMNLIAPADRFSELNKWYIKTNWQWD